MPWDEAGVSGGEKRRVVVLLLNDKNGLCILEEESGVVPFLVHDIVRCLRERGESVMLILS